MRPEFLNTKEHIEIVRRPRAKTHRQHDMSSGVEASTLLQRARAPAHSLNGYEILSLHSLNAKFRESATSENDLLL